MGWKERSLFEFEGNSMGTQTKTWPKFNIGEKATVEQILVSEERNKFKRAELWE